MSQSNLESFLRSVEADLPLRAFQEPVESDLAQVDEIIRGFFESPIGLVQGLASHLGGLRGKRFRPTLLLLVARIGTMSSRAASTSNSASNSTSSSTVAGVGPALDGSLHANAVFGASIIELIHTATLIHDDTIDKSLVRRGLPTINALYDGYVSTILGDFIYTKAFLELIERGMPKVVHVVARTTYRMSIGEMLQIEQRGDLDIDEADYFHLIDEKTASLMSAATHIGALVAGLPDDGVERWRRFGELLGRAYQITDDLFDYIGDQGRLGKGTRSDLIEGKITLPFIHAYARANTQGRARLREFGERRTLDADEWDELLELFTQTGAIEYCRTRASALADEAFSQVDFDLLRASATPGEARLLDAVERAVAYAVQRDH